MFDDSQQSTVIKVNDRNNRKRYEICPKLTPFSCVSIADFEQVNICWETNTLGANSCLKSKEEQKNFSLNCLL